MDSPTKAHPPRQLTADEVLAREEDVVALLSEAADLFESDLKEANERLSAVREILASVVDTRIDDTLAQLAHAAGVPLVCGDCMQVGEFVERAPTRCSICNRTRMLPAPSGSVLRRSYP